MQFIEYCIESKKQNGCKCIGCLPSWRHAWLGAAAHCPGKNQNSTFEVQFLLNTSCFHTIVQSNHEVNHRKSGTICILFKIPQRIHTWLSWHANPEMLETSLCSLPAYYLVFQEVPQYIIRTDLPAPSPSAPCLPCLLRYFSKPTSCYTAGTQYMFELN